MFREMRRKGQQISAKECAEILSNAKSGVLGLHGDDGYPYTVPVSFVYTPGPGIEEAGAQTEGIKAEQLPAGTLGTIGFHCAKTGHKIDAIRRNEKVSFTVVAMDEIMPKERTTKFCSVIVFGKARILEGDENLRRAANAVGAKYSSGYEDLYKEETEDTIRRGTLCCVEITIGHFFGLRAGAATSSAGAGASGACCAFAFSSSDIFLLLFPTCQRDVGMPDAPNART